MLEIVFFIFLSVYFVQSIIFLVGARKKFPKLDENKLPSVSVVVAARNEEDNILDCIQSLDNLIYPEDKIEIIIANDHSEDNTGKIIEEFISDKSKFKLVIPEKQIGSLKGKANAIANALEYAKGEVILTTDADCIVSPTWAKTIASYYADDVAMVCGFTDQFSDNYFGGMQSMDFIYLLTVASGTMNLGKPLSCIGNNMSYRKSVYDEVGGYESIPFSVTEDFSLLMTFHNLKKYKIIYPVDEGAHVTSKPCPDPKSLYWQKKRWGVGGLDSDIVGFGVMASAFAVHLIMLLIPFFFSTTLLYGAVFKFFVDYFFLKSIHNRLKINFKVSHFIAFEFYFIFYVLVLPTLLLFDQRVKWKGREYNN